jgi:hypothetical protein
VLRVDEKSQIQAPDRTAPILPMLPGVPSARPTTTSAPAPPASTPPGYHSGQVIGRLHSRHRAIEFKQFLQMLDREVPAQLDVHDVLDNSSTHKTPAIQEWLRAHPRFVLHFTPTSSSWLNLVERWFAELTSKKLRRGAHRSVRALKPRDQTLPRPRPNRLPQRMEICRGDTQPAQAPHPPPRRRDTMTAAAGAPPPAAALNNHGRASRSSRLPDLSDSLASLRQRRCPSLPPIGSSPA